MNRYSRLAAIPSFGEEGVRKLRESRVLVIGCGALGSHCAMGLAASGIGNICIADFDTIDLSNLQRQLFFDEQTLGKSKCGTLASRMHALNSEVIINQYDCMINEKSAFETFANYDFIIDGSDNPATKLMTSKVCERLGKPYCIGGVKEFSGQVMSWEPGHCGYSELFGDTPGCTGILPCSVAGVLGPAAGVTASIQASEAIKHLAGCGKMLYDKLFTFDLNCATAHVFGAS